MALYRKNRYKATKTKVMYKGQVHILDSKLEANLFEKLIILERGGEIHNLERQPKFTLTKGFTVLTDKTKNGKSKIPGLTYTADFRYIENGLVKVVECKGFADTAYKMRKKLFLFKMEEFGVDVFEEVFAKTKAQYRPVKKLI